jgi:hypothetical protein
VAFSGTWETTVGELFPLFCPAREADWIPGWDCELVYTESGYAEENCIFKTDQANAVGEGLWIFTEYEVNHCVGFVRIQRDLVVRARITVADNEDGTVTATWDTVYTGLTEDGNEAIAKISEEDPHRGALVRMIDHYLKQGRTVTRASLLLGMVAQNAKGHLANQGN